MNKGITAVLGVVVVAMLGAVGTYIYVESAIKSGIETTFNDAAKTDGIDAASFQSIDVNLIGDTVILKNVKSTYDVKTLMAIYGNLPAEVKFDGKVKETLDTVTLKGIRDIAFGGTTLSSMRVIGGRLTLQGSVQGPDLQDGREGQGLNAPPTGTAGMNFDMTFDIAELEASGLDVSAFLAKGQPSAEDFMNFTAKHLSLASMIAKGTFHATENGKEKTGGPVRIVYKVADFQGADITPKTYGAMTANDISLAITPVEKPAETITLTARSFEITDSRFIDSVPVKIAYEINDLVLKPGQVKDPKFQTSLALIGIDEINLDLKMAYDIDPEAGTGAMGPFVVNLKQAGRFDVAMELGGLPGIDVLKRMQDAPDSIDQAQLDAIMSKVTVKNAALGYADGGILKKFVAAQAMQLSGGDLAPVADGFARQGAGLVAMSHGPEKAQEVYGVLNTYLNDPGEIRIQLGAEDPINLASLIQSFAILGPQALGVFDLSVTAPQ